MTTIIALSKLTMVYTCSDNTSSMRPPIGYMIKCYFIIQIINFIIHTTFLKTKILESIFQMFYR